MVNLFSRPVRGFGNVAVLILCLVLFLIPFAMRGARMSLTRMENNVKDWLPSDFPETKDLEWFGQRFVGERFILITWPGCTEEEERFNLLQKKLQNEVLLPDEEALEQYADGNDEEAEKRARERLRARRIGDEHGLLALADPEDYFEDWGGMGEKWLRGHRDSWYYITPDGKLYRWTGKQDLWDAAWRGVMRLSTGQNQADGELIATLGEPTNNEFHRDPRRLGARLIKSLETGPQLLEELASEGGPMWPRMSDVADEDKPYIARREALARLTGSLYGPAVSEGFDWESDSFFSALPPTTRERLPADWRPRLDEFVDRLIEKEYQGDREALINSSPRRHSSHWEDLFHDLGVPAPPRQTCLMATLSEVGKTRLGRVVGRPLLLNPPGKLIDVATNECQVPLEELKLGGPPVDNVAIDEEGSITLFNLIGWSSLVGVSLSYLCFRSIRLTIMVFFVGGVSAVASLSMVWWCGASVDAVLMSMPALVYVLGLAGAVHIINYYQEAVREHGLENAPERALADGWAPCTLAAFTTALGLMSLYASNLMPIKKFGLYSAIGVLMTLSLLFSYLPAALQIWPSRDSLPKAGGRTRNLAYYVEQFWVGVGRWIIKRHALVATVCVLLTAFAGYGLTKIETSVQLMKLFDPNSKVIRDYSWLEANFGKLVPMELVVRVGPEMLKPTTEELATADKSETQKERFKLDFLERMELVARVQGALESVFGAEGEGFVGQGLSAVTFAPELPPPAKASIRSWVRQGFKTKLEQSRGEFLESDYLREEAGADGRDSELWRISLRIAALQDVPYEKFLHRQKLVVEPILSAYRYREQLLRNLEENFPEKRVAETRIAVLGVAKPSDSNPVTGPASTTESENGPVEVEIDQAKLFANTFSALLMGAGYERSTAWASAKELRKNYKSDSFANVLKQCDCVMLVDDNPAINVQHIQQSMRADGIFIDARDHQYQLGTASAVTAKERDANIHVVYTGVVPVVYKAQETLLLSLADSIGLAFVMIAVVMMVLLRDWGVPLRPWNLFNIPAGAVSMLPNLFPVLLLFGLMGHGNVLVDIGTMMCASVAMGVAVDDTVHFLTWFRNGIRRGLDRNEALISAYRRVATAMTQTTLIGGLGLAVFGLSTFTPTQRFGVMMVALLAAALIGDLILLPALLAGPLGRFFCPRSATRVALPEGAVVDATLAEGASHAHPGAPHRRGAKVFRQDSQH